MKILKTTLYGICAGLIVLSCTDIEQIDDFKVDKPLSVELQEQIDAYDPLKTYSGDMELGAGLTMSTYMDQGVSYRLVNSNFTQVTLTNGMFHSDLVDVNGVVNAEGVSDVVKTANDAGLSVYGSVLTWHQNQSAEFLNSTIAPIIIPAEGGPQWLEITANDFESDDASNIVTNDGAVLTYTTDGEGANGEGRAMVISNSAVRDNDWESQMFVVWDEPTQVGERYRLTMDIRADEVVTYPTQAQVVAFQYKHWDFFGQFNATTEWNNVVVEITVDANTSECAALAFNLGAVATNYYFDNIKLEKFNEDGGGPTWDLLSGNDFETDDNSNYQSNGANAVLSFTAPSEGANGEGRALVIENAQVRDNDWESQLFFTFGEPTEVGQQLRLTMDVKADAPATMATQAQTAPGAYKHWDFFGAISATTEWTSVNVQINVSAETSECNTIAFNLGNTATTYYFDNIEVHWYNEEGTGETIIEKTPEEKKDTLSIELENWIAGIMQSGAGVVAWDVIKDPMDDANPSDLRTGGGEELPANVFYWQDYLGKDYGPIAFKLARQYADDGDMLFISESNLESNLDKCQGLIDYVEYIEEQGAVVDGIATQMHLGIGTDKTSIDEMFKMLATTGKMIKVSELNVALSEATTPTLEMLELQAEMYQYVLESFAAQVPVAQRYGVTVWGPSDASTWQGLWNSAFTRKPAYASFAEALDSM
ncbi:MAG: endo-1,4-beta-xylanase [Cyclobacteriaceae bacterium]